ncbi:MAG: hypothetical protein E6Q50_04955 [Lysobacter sp.]|nr:MAG: hypothetical protein E6Q50_04955 [Lysobacter sp.]
MDNADNKNSAAKKKPLNPFLINAAVFAVGFVLILLYATLIGVVEIDLYFLNISASGVKVISTALKEIGLAFLVASIINISIERFNRIRHEVEKSELIAQINAAHTSQKDALIGRINKHMFESVFERDIPSPFFQEIKEQLLETFFLRTTSEYNYCLTQKDRDYAKLIVRHRYSVKNLTTKDQTYNLRISIDVLKKFENDYCFVRIGIGDTFHENEDIKIAKTKKGNTYEIWEACVPQVIKSQEEIKCEIEYERLSQIHGKEVACSLLPTARMAVRVNDPNKLFHVRCMSLHPRSERDNTSSYDDGTYEWEIDGALFPGQGFLIDWVLREPLNNSEALRDKDEGARGSPSPHAIEPVGADTGQI